MRFKHYVLLLALVISVAVVSVAFAQDDEEPTMTLELLSGNDIVIAIFEDEVNAHLYAFFGSQGDVVTITMNQRQDSLLDPYLVLLGPAGEVYAADDDSGELDLAAEIRRFRLPQDGSYFILATSFSGLRQEADPDEDPQEYELILIGATTPDDIDDPERIEFFAATLEVGDEAVLEITDDEPVFYVRFVGSEGDVVSIITEQEGDELDTLLYLFDPNGNRIAVNDDVDFAGGDYYAAIEDVELPEDGVYLIFAMAFDFNRAYGPDWVNTGTFRLIIR
jgi:hypothetical protein